MLRFALVAALATLALAPSPASADAVCSLDFHVRFDDQGGFTQDGAGDGRCVGNVAGNAMDPATANPSIAGRVTDQCVPATGTLVLRPRRALEIWSPELLELAGDWRAVGGALSGDLIVDATAVAITGTAAFAGGCSDTGRLHMQLVLGNERPAPRGAPAQPAASADAKPAPRRATRKRKSCRRGKAKARAAKRCRRARAQRRT